jgi:hypothetical protein
LNDNNSTEIPPGEFIDLDYETTFDDDLTDEMTLNFVKEREKKIIDLQENINLNDEILFRLKNKVRAFL